MTKSKMNRISAVTALLALVFGAAAVAAAEAGANASAPPAREQCSGKHEGTGTEAERAQRKAERFQKADTNGDGFLTKDEVGDKRWEHLKVADTDNDGRVSKAEIEEAYKDGKLGHHGRGGDGKANQS